MSSHVIWKIGDIYWRRYKIQETLYIGQRTRNNDASVPFKVVILGPHTVLPVTISCPVIFLESHPWSEISSLSKVILVWGKARSHRAPNLGCRWAESPGWFGVLPKNSAWNVMHEQVHCRDEAANHQLPIPAGFWTILIVSAEECSSIMQSLMQIHWSTRLVILNTTAKQYTCSLNDIYGPYQLEQWSRHCLHMCIPVHSPWLSGYINVVQIILIMLTTAGLLLDRYPTRVTRVRSRLNSDKKKKKSRGGERN